MFPFYTPWKRQKTFGFWHFKGGVGGEGIDIEHWVKMS